MGFYVRNIVPASRLTTTLATGTVPLPLQTGRRLSGGATINLAGTAGDVASDSTPAISITSGGHRLTWVATNVNAIAWQVFAPIDVDLTQPVVVHVLASMAGAADTPLLGVSFVEGLTTTNVGGNTTALSSSVVEKTVTIAGNTLTLTGNQWTVTLTPAAHGTDALRVDAVWITYTRK